LKKLPLLVLLLVVAGPVFTADFGLLVNQTIEADKNSFTYTPALTPLFSWNGNDRFSVYLSGLLSWRIRNYTGVADGERLFIPELSRFAVIYRINREVFLEAGRIAYNDVTGFAANGLFDGLRCSALLPLGSISAGAFYTGLLYKETAKIIMTKNDTQRYLKSWGADHFGDYFASRRALTALRWDVPVGEMNNLAAEFLAQFDLNDCSGKLHSQYGEVQFTFYPMSMMRITTAALFETMQFMATQNDKGDVSGAFGALAQVKTDLPGDLSDWLSFTVKFTSGSRDGAFTPLTSITQGAIFPGTLAGLALIGADYSVKIIDSLFAEGALRYFIRTFDDPAADGAVYGGEFWASFAWQPFEDMRATLGTGAFFPGLGNVYPSNAGAMWKINAAVTLSL